MENIAKIVYKILVNSLIISVLCLVLAFIRPESPLTEYVFGSLGFYGIIITFYIFVLHVILFLLTVLVKKK